MINPNRIAGTLHLLDLISDTDVVDIEAALDVANRARAFAENFAVVRRNAVVDAARTAISAPDVEAAITKASSRVPRDAAEDIAEQVVIAAEEAADNIIKAKAATFPAKLTEEYDRISLEASTLIPELGGATTPSAAIDLGVGDTWKRLTGLRQQAEAIDEVTRLLRFEGLIPQPRPSQSCPEWNYRDDVDADALSRARQLDPSGLMAWTVELARLPWVPESAEAVEALIASREQVAA